MNNIRIYYTVRYAVFSFLIFCCSLQTNAADLDAPHDQMGCSECHDMGAYDLPNMVPNPGHSPQNIDDTLYNTTVCWKCHDGSDPDIPYAETHSSRQTDNDYGTWTIQCVVCHNQHKQEQDHLFGTTYGMFIRRNINLAKILDNAPPYGVTVAGKSGARAVKFTGPDTFADNSPTVDGICQVCHTKTKYYKNDGTGAAHNSGADCFLCHGHSSGFKGSGHLDTHFRWDGGCKGCHGAGDGSEAVVATIHANNCDLCHTTGGPYDADTNKVGDNGDGDATLAEGDAGTWTATCETCHNQTQVPGFHGITIAEASSAHNNLGSSRGAWADSGGTIPSTRAAGYTGKIDTANALIDDDYNCADCHDLDRTGFTAIEALEVHLFESGRGNGNCATCHRASIVADEITAGIGGSTIECEDCHSLANGNGPSGKKMYQYDGIRHHKTVDAQTGNCTRCHADPRPADLSAEPGHAGTAAINDGSDGDGITWDDGFDDDFGINNPNPRPTQMGCRLCHTNYETYTVNVRAEVDADWDTTELPDLHGYNKTPPAQGLTVYANDFDAKGTTLTYLDSNNSGGVLEDALKIEGAQQTTQNAIPSHRIDAVDGSSKINVLNFGACFSCHTVQIRHAAPKPAEDYDIPILAFTAAARNTHPYDTLRYSPGRSVFNDFRGTTVTDVWNDHTKEVGWLAFNDLNGRGRQVFLNMAGTYWWDSVENYSANSLVTVPVNANVNQLEDLPGLTLPTTSYTIRNFDAGPASPVVDDITITVAQWTGSSVYVEATSSLGSAQDFSFTYTGAGGPCNTSMTWNNDHYEGTCLAASGWSANNTVTVSNNTTATPDEKSRTLNDLTLNPVTPVLSGIVLADNNDYPFPAEAGYTNSLTVAVSLTAANYPTKMILAEDADFEISSTGWVNFDTSTTFTFMLKEDPDNEVARQVFCKVKNGAGESTDLSSSIILDTTSPVILSDTLTSPNGSEVWAQATLQNITWTNTDISDANLKTDPIYLDYSTDGGSSYGNVIASGLANDGSHAWTINTIQSSTAKVRISARDKAGNVASDESDSNFTLAPYVVTNTNDSGAGSLRQVITDLEAAGGNHKIWFNIPNTDPNIINGVAVISLLTDLPPITKSNIQIEGDSQTLLQGDTNLNGPEIRIDGPGSGTGIIIEGITGSHSLANESPVLIDPAANWTINELVGRTVYNITDGSSGTITANNTADITATLGGGTENDWDIGDRYSVSGSGDSISIDNLQITNFTTGISSSGYDTSLEYNQLGFSSDSTGYGSRPNTTNAVLSGRYPNVYNQNYFGCATTGLNISDSSEAYVDGNTFGLFPDAASCPNTTYAILVGAASVDASISANVISGSTNGIYIDGTSSNTTISGNTIGGGTNGIHFTGSSQDATMKGNQIGVEYSGGTWTDLTGPSYGIYVDSNSTGGHTIGGPLVASSDSNLLDSNVIGASSIGIYINQAQNYNHIKMYGNFIGTNPADQSEDFEGSIGIRVRWVSGATIGGGEAGESGNVITGMGFVGIDLYSSSTQLVRISQNSIYGNGDNVGDDGIYFTSSTANGAMTRPAISGLNSNTATVSGILSGQTVEVYHSDYDGTGSEYGEGMTLIGTAVSSGNSVDVDISAASLSAGDWVTALRYTVNGDTSPFSANVKVPGLSAPSLDWTGEANYTTDGVNPNSAISGSTFTFRVEYTDADNDPPQTMEVWIDEDDSNSYEADEKFTLNQVNIGDTNYADGKLYWLSRTITLRSGGMIDYRFHATDGNSDATGTPATTQTFSIQPCVTRPVVDANGTYFEAEKFTKTIVQGSQSFVVTTNFSPYNGTGHFLSSGTNLATPPAEGGVEYELDFPTAGTYTIWIRGYNWYFFPNDNSAFVGLDGTWTGAIATATQDTWEWSSTPEVGVATITIAPGDEGPHTLNFWVRESWFGLDAIYITTGAETPSDATVPSGATVVDPSLCLP